MPGDSVSFGREACSPSAGVRQRSMTGGPHHRGSWGPVFYVSLVDLGCNMKCWHDLSVMHHGHTSVFNCLPELLGGFCSFSNVPRATENHQGGLLSNMPLGCQTWGWRASRGWLDIMWLVAHDLLGIMWPLGHCVAARASCHGRVRKGWTLLVAGWLWRQKERKRQEENRLPRERIGPACGKAPTTGHCGFVPAPSHIFVTPQWLRGKHSLPRAKPPPGFPGVLFFPQVARSQYSASSAVISCRLKGQ